jgi:hypothetical protein
MKRWNGSEGGAMSKVKIIVLLVVALTSSLMTLQGADAVGQRSRIGEGACVRVEMAAKRLHGGCACNACD